METASLNELEGLDVKTLLSTMFSWRWLALILPSDPSSPHKRSDYPIFKFGLPCHIEAEWTYLRAVSQNGWAPMPANPQF